MRRYGALQSRTTHQKAHADSEIMVDVHNTAPITYLHANITVQSYIIKYTNAWYHYRVRYQHGLCGVSFKFLNYTLLNIISYKHLLFQCTIVKQYKKYTILYYFRQTYLPVLAHETLPCMTLYTRTTKNTRNKVFGRRRVTRLGIQNHYILEIRVCINSSLIVIRVLFINNVTFIKIILV